MSKRMHWIAVVVLLAVNGLVYMGFSEPLAATDELSVRQCGCVYGGDPSGPLGPGTVECLVFFQHGCEDIDDCTEPCPEVE